MAKIWFLWAQHFPLFKPSFFAPRELICSLGIFRVPLRVFSVSSWFLPPKSFFFSQSSSFWVSLILLGKSSSKSSCLFCFSSYNSGYQNSALRRTCLYPPVRKPSPIVASPVVIRPLKYFYWRFYFHFVVFDTLASLDSQETPASSVATVVAAFVLPHPSSSRDRFSEVWHTR